MESKKYYNDVIQFENSQLVLVKLIYTNKIIGHYTLYNEYIKNGKIYHYKNYNYKRMVKYDKII